MHFGEKPFQCITCRRSFTTSDLLIYHQGTHSGEVSFDCKSCQHVKIGHQNTMRVFKCEPCNTDFDCKVHMFIYKLAYKGRYLFGIDSPDETQLDSIALNEIQWDSVKINETQWDTSTLIWVITGTLALDVNLRNSNDSIRELDAPKSLLPQSA